MYQQESLGIPFGFYPNSNWNGEILCTFVSEFFAFTLHAKTSWKSTSVLCCSINPLVNGDSAAVVTTPMLIDSHSLRNILFANSPPLSVWNLSAGPHICIQQIIDVFNYLSLGPLMVWQLLQKVVLYDQQDEVTYYDKVWGPWLHTLEMMILKVINGLGGDFR